MKKHLPIYSILLLLLLSFRVQAQCPTLVWSDEFDGTSLDLNKWEPQIGDGCDLGICGWGNNELQYYKAENAVVSNGTLKIIAKKERVQASRYTSARLRSKGLGDFTFGRFEARIKMMLGPGLWPAFWMLSTNEPYGTWPQSGEIDIMEYLGQHPEEVFGTIHYGDPFPGNRFTGKEFKYYDGATDFSQDFHNFAVEWEPDVIRWYVDGILYQTLTRDDIAPYNWPFDSGNQMHFLLNLAVGGTLPGDPDATTPFPSQMEIDYVRVYDTSFPPSISGERLVSYQEAGTSYSINNAPNNASFNWSLPAGATITSGAGTSSITVDWGGTSGDVTCDVTTSCGTQQYKVDVIVEPEFVYDFTFENFDAPANVSLSSSTGTLTEVSNPDASGVNTSATSAEYVRDSQSLYDLIVYNTSSITDASIYSSRSQKFYMDVYTQAPVGTEIIIQLENSSAATSSNYPAGRHSRYVGTVTQNGTWERIEFDLLDQPDGSTDPASVDQIIILAASNTNTGDTYYFDNFDSYKPVTTGGTSNAAPTASFGFTANSLSVSFDGSASSDSDGSISSWSWDFGDGNTGSGATASHTYATDGSYTVTLTVTDNEGATDVQSQTVSVSSGSTGTPSSMYVQSITAGSVSAGKGQKSGTATVVIYDDLGNTVSNATVTGTFSGSFSETVTGTTGADGSVTFTTSAAAKGSLTINFCVDNVTGTLTYDAASNTSTCIAGTGRLAGNSNLGQQAPAEYAAKLYPNPANSHVSLDLSANEDGTLQIRMFNMKGQVVRSYTQQVSKGEYRLEINLEDLQNGLYYIQGRFNDNAISQKLVKQ